MDGTEPLISPHDVYVRLGTAKAPIVIDVRRPDPLVKTERLIASAFHRPPDKVEQWPKDLPHGHAVVVRCACRHEVSQGATAVLHLAEIDAGYVEGGIDGWSWTAKKLPTPRDVGPPSGKWVTRERPKIDRHDPAFDHLAMKFRGDDTARRDLVPRRGGWSPISLRLSTNFSNEHEMLARGCDAVRSHLDRACSLIGAAKFGTTTKTVLDPGGSCDGQADIVGFDPAGTGP
jgi:rhodanese-related sulfurtransferase